MITFSGLKEFTEKEVLITKEISMHYDQKITKKVLNASFHLTCKAIKKEGSKKEYSFIVRVNDPSVQWSTKAEDWDLKRALHKVFTNAQNRIKHQLKLEGYKKPRR